MGIVIAARGRYPYFVPTPSPESPIPGLSYAALERMFKDAEADLQARIAQGQPFTDLVTCDELQQRVERLRSLT